MATYNGERFIREQLESIARQTLPPYELIVTDDGSSDCTLDIISDFSRGAPFPIHLHRNETRLGYPDNFLKAASLCRGDLIAFSDQDDVWLSGKLARCADSFKDESVLLTVHSGKVVDAGLRPMGWLFPEIDRDAVISPLTVGPGRGLSGFAMVFRSCLPLVFNRQRPWSSVDQNEFMIHDQWVCFLANVFGKTAFIREPLVLFRRHNTTATNPARLPISELARRSLSAGAESYVKMAQLAGHRASYLDQAVAFLQEGQRISASKGARHYRYVEEILYERFRIYRTDKHIWTRFGALIRLVARGGYGRQSLGGLGFRSFLKDASVGVLGINHWV